MNNIFENLPIEIVLKILIYRDPHPTAVMIKKALKIYQYNHSDNIYYEVVKANGYKKRAYLGSMCLCTDSDSEVIIENRRIENKGREFRKLYFHEDYFRQYPYFVKCDYECDRFSKRWVIQKRQYHIIKEWFKPETYYLDMSRFFG